MTEALAPKDILARYPHLKTVLGWFEPGSDNDESIKSFQDRFLLTYYKRSSNLKDQKIAPQYTALRVSQELIRQVATASIADEFNLVSAQCAMNGLPNQTRANYVPRAGLSQAQLDAACSFFAAVRYQDEAEKETLMQSGIENMATAVAVYAVGGTNPDRPDLFVNPI